jgi:hypothetical protein
VEPFVRRLAALVIILGGLAAAVGLLALFAGEPATGASIIGAALGVALFAGILWMLAEVCKMLGNISQVLDDDICGAFGAGLTVGSVTRNSRASTSPVESVREAG